MTTDPVVLFVRPKEIRPADKKMLREAGILVVEISDPSKVKMTRAHAEIHSTDLLGAALNAILSDPTLNKQVQSEFARRLAKIYLTPPTKGPAP